MHDTVLHKVVWINDPFNPNDSTKTDVYSAPNGQTIRQWLNDNNGFARLKQRPTVCVMDGQELCHADYDRLIDQPVCFVALPLGGDGGSNPLALIASIGLMMFASWAVGPAALALTEGSAALYATQAGIMMAGGMMINALLPPAGMPDTANPSQGSPTYSISTQGNTARLRQPIPVSYGKSPCFPDFAAQPYREFDGNEQYLNMLLSVGVGYHQVSDIKLDLTPIENFSEAVYEVVNPFDKVTLFHTAVINAPEAGGQDLNKPIAHGPYIINNIDQPITRVAFDVVFPGGLIGTDEESGDEYSVGVHLVLVVEPVNDNDVPTGQPVTVFNGTISDRTRTAIRRSFYADIPSGRYQATIQRTTGEAPRNEIKGCQLAGVRGFIADDNEYGDLTLLAVRVRASENNVSTKLNCVDQRLIPVWNSATGWSEPVATRNPAWAFADAVRARYGGDFADTELNLPELEWLAGVFEERGDTFDGRFDTENNLWSALEQIGQVCRSRPIRHGLQLRMLRDQKQQGPVAVFSGANIKDFAVDYVMATEAGADSVLMTYLDETKNYQERTVLCQLPDATAEKPAEVTLFGAVNRDQVYLEGMYLAKTNRSRRQMVSFTTGREGKVPKWGDLVHINHPRLGPGKKFAGLVVAESGQELTLSQAIDLADHNSWLVVLRDRQGLPSIPMTFEQISDNRIRISEPLPFVPEVHPNRERTHFMIAPGGEVVYPVKVLGIEPANEADVRVSGVLEDDTVHDDGGVAPPLPPDVGIPPAAPGLITDLRATQGGTLTQPVINLSWAPAPRSDKYLIEYSSDNRKTWQPAGSGVSLLHEHSFVCDPGNITVRVAGLGAMKGEWVMLDLVAGGNFDTPGQVAIELAEPFVGDALKLRWTREPATANYLIRVFHKERLARELYLDHTHTTFDYSYLDAQRDGAGRNLTVKIRAENANRVPGPWAEVSASNPLPAVPGELIIEPLIDSFIIRAAANNEADIKEFRVHGSQNSGFAPGVENQLYVGATPWASLVLSGRWYFRCAWVDNWGSADLNYSVETSGDSGEVDLGPVEDALADLDDKIGVIGGDIGNIETDLSGLQSGLNSEVQQRQTADSQLNQRIDTNVSRIGNNAAAIVTEAETRASADETLSRQITTVISEYKEGDADNSAAIQQESEARASADTALGKRIDTVQAKANSNSAAIQTESEARADADGALGKRIDTVQAVANGNKATVQQHSTAIASIENGVEKLEASWGVTLDVNGYCSGFAMNNDGDRAEALFRADTFAVGAPGAKSLTFVVQDGSVMMPGVSIQNGSIKTEKLAANSVVTENLAADAVTADKLHANTASFIVANMEDGSINNALIGNFIQSKNYEQGRAGWHINKTGHAEFQNVLVRGRIVGSIIEGSFIVDDSSDWYKTTEADTGAGTRYFGYASNIYEHITIAQSDMGGSNHTFTYNKEYTFSELKSADYTAEGTESKSPQEGVTPVVMYKNQKRFIKFKNAISVDISVQCPICSSGASFIAGSTSSGYNYKNATNYFLFEVIIFQGTTERKRVMSGNVVIPAGNLSKTINVNGGTFEIATRGRYYPDSQWGDAQGPGDQFVTESAIINVKVHNVTIRGNSPVRTVVNVTQVVKRYPADDFINRGVGRVTVSGSAASIQVSL